MRRKDRSKADPTALRWPRFEPQARLPRRSAPRAGASRRNETPNPKHQSPEKSQTANSKTCRRLAALEFATWSFFGVWSLEFGASSNAGSAGLPGGWWRGRVRRRRDADGDDLPALRAEAQVAFDEFPDDDFGVREQLRAPEQFLAHKRRSAPVIDDAGERAAERPREVGNEAGARRLVLLIDAQETVTEHEHVGRRVVRVERAWIAPHDLRAGGGLGANALLNFRRTQHPRYVSNTLHRCGSAVIAY